MRWFPAWALVFLLFAAPLTVQADVGRAAPGCLTQTSETLPSTLDVDPGTCVIVDLGALQPGDVYDLSIIVVDDALDVLFFDENSIQPYELGQSYRSVMAQPASTESALGALEFHWKVPPSISAKRWYMVLDNTAHDGDASEGDQGGLRSTVSATVERLDQAYWTPYHDLLSVDAGGFDVLLSGDDLRLDAGTTVVLSAWDLTFVGDVYLQTRTMHDRYLAGGVGVQFIEGGALQSVETPQSLTWQVPTALEGEELLLVVDNTDAPLGGGNGTELLRISVRLELAPPLTPVITDEQMATVSLGESLSLNASSTPNRLGQQGTFSWDYDASVDSDNDGNPTNDADATGVVVAPSWALPGEKTVSVVMTAPSGQQASTTYAVMVQDVTPPVARIQSNGTPVSGGWRIDVNNAIQLFCTASTDDHQIDSCDWTIDGQVSTNVSSLTFTPDEIRMYEVSLTVKDASANVGTISAVINSVDPTVPRFDPSLLPNFPTTATEGEAVSFQVVVFDEYDADATLRVHWDLQPGKDTDGNGVLTDDPDRVGLNPTITFGTPGKQEIVVTVFDNSNNSVNYAFSIDIADAPASTSSPSFALIAFLVVLVLGGAGLVGFQTVQRNRGFNLLIEKGLSSEEARAHMAGVAQQSKLGFFSKPEDYAGADMGEAVSVEERRAAQAKAEMEAIYGSSNQADVNAGFAPPSTAQVSMSQASSQAAAEAAAMFNDDDTSFDQPMDDLVEEIAGASAVAIEMPAATSSPVSLPVDSSAAVALPSDASASTAAPEESDAVAMPISLPETVAAAQETPPEPAPPAQTPPALPSSQSVRHTCTSCGAVFEIDMPAGLRQALVACPACASDQTIVLDG